MENKKIFVNINDGKTLEYITVFSLDTLISDFKKKIAQDLGIDFSKNQIYLDNKCRDNKDIDECFVYKFNHEYEDLDKNSKLIHFFTKPPIEDYILKFNLVNSYVSFSKESQNLTPNRHEIYSKIYPSILKIIESKKSQFHFFEITFSDIESIILKNFVSRISEIMMLLFCSSRQFNNLIYEIISDILKENLFIPNSFSSNMTHFGNIKEFDFQNVMITLSNNNKDFNKVFFTCYSDSSECLTKKKICLFHKNLKN